MQTDDLRATLRDTLASIAGNALVALAYGCEIQLTTEADGSGDCLYRDPTGRELPAEVHRPVCIAGPIAEEALRQGGPDHLTAEYLQEHFQTVGLVVPDYAAGYTLADIELALRLLTERWPLVVEQVEMREYQILNGGAKPH